MGPSPPPCRRPAWGPPHHSLTCTLVQSFVHPHAQSSVPGSVRGHRGDRMNTPLARPLQGSGLWAAGEETPLQEPKKKLVQNVSCPQGFICVAHVLKRGHGHVSPLAAGLGQDRHLTVKHTADECALASVRHTAPPAWVRTRDAGNAPKSHARWAPRPPARSRALPGWRTPWPHRCSPRSAAGSERLRRRRPRASCRRPREAAQGRERGLSCDPLRSLVLFFK